MFDKLATKAGRIIIRSLDYIKRERKKNSTMWIYYNGSYFRFDIEYTGDLGEEDKEEEDEH